MKVLRWILLVKGFHSRVLDHDRRLIVGKRIVYGIAVEGGCGNEFHRCENLGTDLG